MDNVSINRDTSREQVFYSDTMVGIPAVKNLFKDKHIVITKQYFGDDQLYHLIRVYLLNEKRMPNIITDPALLSYQIQATVAYCGGSVLGGFTTSYDKGYQGLATLFAINEILYQYRITNRSLTIMTHRLDEQCQVKFVNRIVNILHASRRIQIALSEIRNKNTGNRIQLSLIDTQPASYVDFGDVFKSLHSYLISKNKKLATNTDKASVEGTATERRGDFFATEVR